MAHDGLEVVLHQLLLDQRALCKGAPDLFRRIRQLPFNHKGNESRQTWSLVHPFQQSFEAIEPVAPEVAIEAHPVDQGGQSFRPGAVVGLASFAPITTRAASFRTARCLEIAGCETPEPSVRACTVCSPSRLGRSKIARRVASAKALQSWFGAEAIDRRITRWLWVGQEFLVQ